MHKPFEEKVCPGCGKVFRIRAGVGQHIFAEHIRYCNAYKISWQYPR
ncbi:hypothetical protein CPT_Merlin141 [Citrobacter phage Merlin]|uniref:C2H2-type domain-containing protein n=1 Tax=Citrobacter phage Merlin TaxID=1675602 RepID=A0A0K1LMM5_9CAUD|nr:hypothetical protein CPT_Merlin141 [Citrobacter phage Merlin]AKU43787.1 hypothetical protein CPT_Merlin141 [Citrobacter phage Merlin]